MTQGKMYDLGLGVVRSQGLEEIQVNYRKFKYDYKDGTASFGLHLERHAKSKSLRGFDSNVVLLPNAKRGLSTGEPNCFEKLKMYEDKYVNLIEVVADANFLQGVYKKKIKFKELSDKMLNGLDRKWLKSIHERLSNGSFRFIPARRRMIFKLNKPGLRPLTLNYSNDTIVQQAMQMVLEHIYEPLFLEVSNGYRPSRGCHFALKLIRQK
jgi:hypothetical protein